MHSCLPLPPLPAAGAIFPHSSTSPLSSLESSHSCALRATCPALISTISVHITAHTLALRTCYPQPSCASFPPGPFPACCLTARLSNPNQASPLRFSLPGTRLYPVGWPFSPASHSFCEDLSFLPPCHAGISWSSSSSTFLLCFWFSVFLFSSQYGKFTSMIYLNPHLPLLQPPSAALIPFFCSEISYSFDMPCSGSRLFTAEFPALTFKWFKHHPLDFPISPIIQTSCDVHSTSPDDFFLLSITNSPQTSIPFALLSHHY